MVSGVGRACVWRLALRVVASLSAERGRLAPVGAAVSGACRDNSSIVMFCARDVCCIGGAAQLPRSSIIVSLSSTGHR